MYYSPSSEAAIIGVILREPYYLEELNAALEPSAFSALNKKIIETMNHFLKQGITPDKISILDSNIQGLDSDYLQSCYEQGTISRFEDYVEMVESSRIQRFILNETHCLSEAVKERKMGRMELSELANSALTNVADSITKDSNSISQISDGVQKALQSIRDRANSEKSTSGLSTGFEELDKLIDGLKRTDVIIVSGRPSMGKTTFSYNMAENMGLNGHRGMFFSLEMPTEQIIMRSLASIGRIDQNSLKTGKLSRLEIGKLKEATQRLDDIDLVIDEEAGLSYREIILRAKKEHAKKKLEYILIDYLQLIKAPNIDPNNKNLQVTEISGAIKQLAKDLQVPIIMLSQLNRTLELRADKRPINSDLRDSGSIEQDADLIIHLYRDEVYNEDSPDKGLAEVIIGKHRNGPLGVVRLAFKGQYSKFEDAKIEKELRNGSFETTKEELPPPWKYENKPIDSSNVNLEVVNSGVEIDSEQADSIL